MEIFQDMEVTLRIINSMLDNTKKTNGMAKEFLFGQMAHRTRVLGKTTQCMVQAFTQMKRVQFLKETGSKIILKVSGPWISDALSNYHFK